MFRKSQRMNHSEFGSFFNGGSRSHSKSFTLITAPYPKLKVAVVVSKKAVKTAVGRNRLRRQIVHTLKPLLQDTTGAYIVMVKPKSDTSFQTHTRQELVELVGRAI